MVVSFLLIMLEINGVFNDVIFNFNVLSIICFVFIFNYGLYLFFCKMGIYYGFIVCIIIGFLMLSVGGVGYIIIIYYVYK